MHQHSKKYVLIVEDDLLLQRTHQRLLQNNAIYFATNVADAIKALSTVKFDAVITDYNLDGQKTGEDLIKWISGHQPDLLPKTIVFSGNKDAMRIHTQVVLKPAMTELHKQLAALAG